jgi:hypothetical protein
MKYSIKLCCAWLCLLCLHAQAQNPFWTFPEQNYDSQAQQIGSLPTDDYTGQESDYVHAGLKDPYGEIMFFAMDGKLYDKNGTERSEFDDNVDVIKGGSELLVVPQPGSCNLFYIFQTENKNGSGTDLPHFSVYNDTLGGLVEFLNEGVIKTSLNLVDDPLIDGNPLFDDWVVPDHGVDAIHYAATNLRSDSTRWVFVSNNNYVYRVDLTCDGIRDPDWKYDMIPSNGGSFVENGWRSELELFEDTANNRIRVAAPHYDGSVTSPTGRGNVAIFDIDNATGNVISGSRFNINLPNQSGSLVPSFVHGLEFSPNGEYLFIIHDPYPGATSPLSYYDFSSSSLDNMTNSDFWPQITTISDFAKSQLQIGGTPGNYLLYLVRDSHIATLDDPDTPWFFPELDDDAIPLSGGYSTNWGGIVTTSLEDEKRIIADQIDYMNYDSMFVKASCDCCNKYAYAGSKKDTSDTFTSNDTWTPGLGNNPWNAAATDTIYIRDSLVVKEGVNITISDLNFKFGRDGVFIVRRGNETTPGARLTLTDSTYMSTDFRCSKFDFPCDDPESDDCKNKFWQGIRVEGYDDLSQSLTSSTRQGRLDMDKGCMIEFAQVGILAGHESLNGYGGGIVRIEDSFIKDSPISLQFQKYIATSSGSEIFNLASVSNMHFYWTSAMNTYEKKQFYHVDINRSSGIKLRGNTYELRDWNLFPIKARGIGVNTFNSRVIDTYDCPSGPVNPCPVTVDRSLFLNLGKGVNATSNGSTRVVEFGYGEYENNLYGIHCTGCINPDLLDNDFRVPNQDNRYGIVLTNSTGYDVENNYFTSMWSSPVNRNVGVYVQNSGTDNNQIYRNSFRNITTGIASTKINASCPGYTQGLRWKCNTFDRDIPYADIFVSTGNVADEQGACTSGQNNLSPANNWFSHTPGAFDLLISTPPDITLCTGTSLSIQYFYRNVSGGSAFDQRQEPIDFIDNITSPSSHYSPTQCGGDFPTQNDCPIMNSAAPTGGRKSGSGAKSGDEVAMNLEDYSAILSSFYAQNEEILVFENLSLEDISEDESSALTAFYQVEYDLWKEVISAYQWDTLGMFPREEVYALVNQYQPNSTGSRFTSALANDLGLPTPVWVDASEDVQLEVETPFDFSSVSETIEIDQFVDPEFFNSAANTSALVTTLRESGLNYFTYPMDIEADLPAEYTGVEDDSENKSLNIEEGLESISLVPNPFDNYLLIGVETDQEYENMRIEFFDVLGRHIESVDTGFSGSTEINGSSLPVGIIFYQVYLDGKMSQAGRLVKSK